MSGFTFQRDWVTLADHGRRVLAAAAVAIGVFELYAWWIQPGWIPADSAVYWMKANAALVVVLAGVAAWLADGTSSAGRRAVAAGLAAVALAICVVTLVESVTRWSPGIDTWIATDPSLRAGRMTLQTASVLAMCALSVLVYGSVAGPASWLCDGSLLVAAVTLEVMVAGYFDHASLMFDAAGLAKAARQSGIAQMLLVGALAVGRTGRGAFTIFAGDGMGSTAMRSVMVVVIALPLALGKLRFVVEGFGWITAGGQYGSPVFEVVQTVVLGLTVYVFARYVNRLDARYRAERERRAEIERYVAVCAWTRKIRWQGRWVSIEEYLQQRFGFEVTHGISDEALAEQLASLDLSAEPRLEDATERMRPDDL